uniref:Peroxidase n=1 Tax=Aegilops tauschii TaxID=37682 RepID=M8AYT2_AEGTA
MEAPAARGGERMRLRVVAVVVVLAMAAATARAQLQVGYYDTLCPAAEIIVQQEGCDGSVLLDSTPGNQAEKDAAPNSSLRGFEVIDAAKTRLGEAGVVSCADVLAFAARDALALVGGSSYQVPAGRRDGNVSVAGETNGNLPPPTANVNQLNQIFGSKGLSQAQMVALSGAHTVGMAQCSSFSSRLYSYGTNGGKDPSMDPAYLATLSTQCPQSGASQPVAMDPVTPNTFDTNYYANVAANRGLLASDQALLADNSTAAQVLGYTTSPGTFQTDFASAMVAMGAIGVLTGNQGTIRTNCRVVG